MQNNKLKCAVIGTGNMGKNHVRTYLQIPDVELSAISDTNQELGEKLALENKLTFYADYKEMIDKEKPDVVSICVPTNYHFEVTKYCLNKNINVLLEKPIAPTIEQAQEILDLAEKNNIKLLVGHIERFNPAVKKVKEMITKGELGNITAIIARRVGGFPPQIKDANIAVDLAIHDIDIVNYLLDELPLEISVNKQKNHIEQREDSVEFFLKYKKTSAYIQANWITPVKIRQLTITGTEGYLEMDYITQQIEFYKSNYQKFKEGISDFSDYILRFSEPDKFVISVAKKEPLAEELNYFIKCISDDIKISSHFGLDALKISLFN
ncbi:MAG: Gfo/Idh/MocA family oxidoreductase [Patescibacteria group bacterium]|nr:Gfo/Idh/MocA family oxidoreductase [Patescibacteria group bacterium]